MVENIKVEDYLKLDHITFNKWNSNTIGLKDPIGATLTLDNVHDDLGHHGNNSKPGDWEDKIIESTKIEISGSDTNIEDVLNTYSKCIEIDPTSSDSGNIPYTIPDNTTVCYVKDCFPGTCVPGLNNLLDQSSASLDTFITTVSTQAKLSNPMKDSSNALGVQNKNLLYTAYFNFDLLIFKYIYENYNLSTIPQYESMS